MVTKKLEERMIIRRDGEEDDWVKSWESGLAEFNEALRAANSLPAEQGTAAEKFKKLIEFKDKYQITNIPSQLIRDIFAPEFDKLQNVHVERIDDGLMLTCKHVIIQIKAGHNSGVFCSDESQFFFTRHNYSSPTEENESIIKIYKQFKEGEITRQDLALKMTEVVVESRKKAGLVTNESQMFLNLRFDIYHRQEIFEQILKRKEEYNKQEADNRKLIEKNEKREKMRREILEDSKLLNLLKSLQKEGIWIESDGLVDDDFFLNEAI